MWPFNRKSKEESKPRKKRASFFSPIKFVDNEKKLHIFLSILMGFMGCLLLFLGAVIPHIDAFMIWLTGIEITSITPADLKIKDLSLNHSEKLIGTGLILVILAFITSIIATADRALQAWKSFMRREPTEVKVIIDRILIEKAVGEILSKREKETVDKSLLEAALNEILEKKEKEQKKKG